MPGLVEFISVRNLNTALSLVCIVVSAAVCTFLAVESGDRALQATRNSGASALQATRVSEQDAQQSITAAGADARATCFGTAESNVLRNTDELLAKLVANVRTSARDYLKGFELLASQRSHSMRTMHPSQVYNFDTFKQLTKSMYSELQAYHEPAFVTGMSITNTRNMGIVLVEDKWTMKGHALGQMFRAEMLKQTGDPHNHYWRPVMTVCDGKEVTEEEGQRNKEYQDRIRDLMLQVDGVNFTFGGPGGRAYRCPAGQPGGCCNAFESVGTEGGELDGTWTTFYDPNTPECPRGDCPGVVGFGSSCECNPDHYFPGCWDRQGNPQDPGTGLTPILRDPTHNWTKWATGPCMVGYTVPTDKVVTAAMMLPVNTISWSHIIPIGPYVGMAIFGNYAHPAVKDEPWKSYAPLGKMGNFMYGADVRDITKFLAAVELGSERGRLWITSNSHWMIPQPGLLVGVSKGISYRLVERWSLSLNIFATEPDTVMAIDAEDSIIRESARWIEREGGSGAVNARQEAQGGKAIRYSINHTATESGEVVGEDFYINVQQFKLTDWAWGSKGIDWWINAAIDHEYMLGDIERASAQTRAEIEAKQAEVAATVLRQRRATDDAIAAEKEKVDGDLEDDQTVLIIVVIVVALVLVVVSAIFIRGVTAPILKLAKQMNAVAAMQLDDVDDHMKKSRLQEVRRMQRSFVRMVGNMRELRNYMPQSITQDALPEEEEEEEEPPLSPGGSKGASRASRSQASKSAVSRRSESQKSQSQLSRARGAAASQSQTAASSQSERMKKFMKNLVGQGLKKKKFTVLVCNVVGFHQLCAKIDPASQAHEALLTDFMKCVTQAKGVVDTFSGDRILAGFNTVRQAGTHRVGACTAGRTINAGELRVTSACTTGEGHCGNAGCVGLKKFTVLSSALTFLFALERHAAQCKATGTAVDSGVCEDAGNAFYTRALGLLVFEKRAKKPLPVFEAVGAKAVSEDEWMYQLEEGNKDDPYALWNDCFAAAAAGNWPAAEEAAAQPALLAQLEAADGAWLRQLVAEKGAAELKVLFH